MAGKRKDRKEIKDLQPGKEKSEAVKGGYVPPQPQTPNVKALAKKVAGALHPNRTTPPIQ
jgi:hypothetical protein